MNQKSFLILIGGGTAAGKSSITKKIAEHLQKKGEKVGILSADDYNDADFKLPQKYRKPDGKLDLNWVRNNKEASTYLYKNVYNAHGYGKFNKKQLISDIKDVQKGKSITSQPNKFADGISKPNKVKGDSHIIIEGIHALQDQEINEMADLKIYCDVDADLRLIRKIQRTPWFRKMIGEEPDDGRGFGGDLPLSFEMWIWSIRNSHKDFIEPTKNYADVVITYEDWKGVNKELKKINELIDLYLQDQEQFKKQLELEKSQKSSANFPGNSKIREREREQLWFYELV